MGFSLISFIYLNRKLQIQRDPVAKAQLDIFRQEVSAEIIEK